MRFVDVFIRRPVFAAMLIASLVVLGLFSWARLGLDLFPNVEFPIVVVTTTLKGASVEEMETSVTKVIEEAVNTIDGIDDLHSTTKEGLSTVVIRFVLEKPRDIGAQDVRDKVATVLAQLPVGTDPPVIDKFDVSAVPVMSIAISGRRGLREVTEITRNIYRQGNVKGVLFAAEVFPELRALSGDAGARAVVNARPERVQRVEFDLPMPPDVDTPEDFAKLHVQ